MIYAEILAGGKGSRMGSTEMPKQFFKVGNKPVIIHTIEKFLLEPKFNKIIIVCPAPWIAHTKDIIDKYLEKALTVDVCVCAGGVDRNGSIMSGISYIEENFGLTNEDIVVTHDAVRPFLTGRIIRENIEDALTFGATDTVIPAVDTIVKSSNGSIIEEIPLRDMMYQGQTPQSFNINKLKTLYGALTEEERADLSDAAKIFAIKGHEVKMVRGEIFNIKITSPYDLDIANILVGMNK